MQKRKICAVITLIAFVLTMMPLMAFAATGSGSSIAVDDSSAKANGTDTLKFIVDLDQDLNTKQTTGSEYVYTPVTEVGTKEVLTKTYYNSNGTETYAESSDYDSAVTYYNKVEYTEVPADEVKISDAKYLANNTQVADNPAGSQVLTITTTDAAGTIHAADKKYVKVGVQETPPVEVFNANPNLYYTKDSSGSETYTLAEEFDPNIVYYPITSVDPDTYQNLAAAYYNADGTETYAIGVKYEKGTTYYEKKDSYKPVSAENVETETVLAETYYTQDGDAYTIAAAGTDYDAAETYYTREAKPVTKASQYLFIWPERSGSYSDADYLSLSADATGESYLALDYTQIKKGETTVYVKSTVAGTVALKAYLVTADSKPTFAEVYNGSSEFIRTALIGSGDTGKFSATSSEITVEGTVTPYPSGKAGTSQAFAADQTYDGDLNANNGVDYYYVSLKFKKGGSKLVGEDVTFSVDKNGATLNKEEATTSATGAVNFKVSASKSGTYTVTVDCGSYSESFDVVFGASAITKVQVISSVEETIAVDQNEEVAVELAAYDANGNVIKASNTVASTLNEKFSVEVTSAPADSSLEDEILDDPFKYDPDYSSYIYLSFEPDAVGSYTLKIYNNTTGVAAYAYLTAEEFGTIASATISYDSSSYTLGSTTEAPTVKVVDQNGVTKTASKGATKFSYSGVGVSSFNPNNGVITFKDKDDYVGNQIVVSVVVNNKVSASTTLTIGNEASYLSFKETNGAVGEEVTVTGYAYDVDGNLSAIGGSGGDYTVTVQNALITSKPAGANATIDADNFEDAANNFLTKGYGTVTVSCNKEGTVVGNVVLAITNNTTNKTTYLAGVVTVNFGKASDNTNDYNKNITMIIGANTFVYDGGAYTTDVAPFITNGRTMIAIRALAESTGADVEYNDQTRTVTITGKDLTATMVIGSNILTVNGETTVMDVAASIVDGRTVIPVRYAAEILGYEFELTYDSKGNVVAVTMYQE